MEGRIAKAILKSLFTTTMCPGSIHACGLKDHAKECFFCLFKGMLELEKLGRSCKTRQTLSLALCSLRGHRASLHR